MCVCVCSSSSNKAIVLSSYYLRVMWCTARVTQRVTFRATMLVNVARTVMSLSEYCAPSCCYTIPVLWRQSLRWMVLSLCRKETCIVSVPVVMDLVSGETLVTEHYFNRDI